MAEELSKEMKDFADVGMVTMEGFVQGNSYLPTPLPLYLTW